MMNKTLFFKKSVSRLLLRFTLFTKLKYRRLSGDNEKFLSAFSKSKGYNLFRRKNRSQRFWIDCSLQNFKEQRLLNR